MKRPKLGQGHRHDHEEHEHPEAARRPHKPKPPRPPVTPPPSGGRVIEVRPGNKPIQLHGERGLVIIRFLAGASIRGSGHDGILIQNCSQVRIEGNGGKISGFQNGVRVADTGQLDWDRILINDLDLSGNGIQGVLAVNAWGVTVAGCHADGINGSEKAHFVYWSSFGKPTGKCRMRNCRSRNIRGSDVQGNAETVRQLAGPFEVINCDLGNDEGDFALSVLSADFVIQGGRLHGRCNADNAGAGPSKVLYRGVDRKGKDNAMGGSVIRTA